MTIDLDQTVLDGGRRFVNFFEGRILTGRDLRDEQSAARQGRTTLGRGIGAGVVHGFEVANATPTGTGAVPTVRVSAGLAINRDGQTLDLTADRLVRLAVLDPDSPNQNVGAFELCADQPSTSDAPTAEGFHILTVAPATGYQEEAPKSGLEDDGSAGGCGRRYITLGLRFRLVRFDPALLAGEDIGTEIAGLAAAASTSARSRLRNLVAHLGLGSNFRATFPDDPFSADEDGASLWRDWGIEAALADTTPPTLDSCEVPLAILRLRGGQLSFIDMWSVRRSPRAPAPSRHWPLVGPFARPATDAATYYQFQDQLAWLLVDEGEPDTLAATDYFRALPPVGVLPFSTAANFLPGAPAPIDLDPRRVIPVIEEALAYPVVDLATSPSPGFTIYRTSASADWLLFVSDAVPSEELQAIKCADLEARIDALEERIDAPGVITGRVLIQLGFLNISNRVPVIDGKVNATPTAGPVITVPTGIGGNFSMSVPPGEYVLSAVPADDDTIIASATITVERGETVNVELVGRPQFVFENPFGPDNPLDL